MLTRSRSLLGIVTISVLALVGCSSDDSDGSGSNGGGSGASPEAIIDNSSVAALTGEDIEPGSLSRPALSAKIDNAPTARPQVGLDEADIVFEELVEGGITRYVGIWHSRLPAEVGPMRSVRPMDPEIVSPFGGIFVYSGGVSQFVAMIREAPVLSLQEGNTDAFYRSNAKPPPHNLLLKAPELVEENLNLPAPPRMFDYAPSVDQSTAVVSGETVGKFKTTFSLVSAPSWEWDIPEAKFLRYQTSGAPDVASNGNHLAAANVITLFVGIDVVDEIIAITRLVSQGKGYVASGGSIVEVNWIKATPESPIVLTTLDGEDVLLAKGQTWIELIPNDNSDVQAGAITFN